MGQVISTIPAGSIRNDDIGNGAQIAATKTVARRSFTYQQADGADVVAATVPLATFKCLNASIKFGLLKILTAPTGGDKKYTIDIQKAAGGSTAFTSMLASPHQVDSTSSNGDVAQIAFSTTDIANNDTLRVVVAVSGSTGSQGQGFLLTLDVDVVPDPNQ